MTGKEMSEHSTSQMEQVLSMLWFILGLIIYIHPKYQWVSWIMWGIGTFDLYCSLKIAIYNHNKRAKEDL